MRELEIGIRVIAYGHLELAFTIDGRARFPVAECDAALDDPLPALAALVAAIESGQEPSELDVRRVRCGSFYFEPCPGGGAVRMVALLADAPHDPREDWDAWWHGARVLCWQVPLAVLARAVRRFFAVLPTHPRFILWAGWAWADDAVHKACWTACEEAWARDELELDSFEFELEFKSRYLEAVPDVQAVADQYRTMLATLAVPDGWLGQDRHTWINPFWSRRLYPPADDD